MFRNLQITRLLKAATFAGVLAFSSLNININAPVLKSGTNPADLVWTKPSQIPDKVIAYKQYAFDRRDVKTLGMTLSLNTPVQFRHIDFRPRPIPHQNTFEFPHEWVSALTWGAVATILASVLLSVSGLSIPETLNFIKITR